MNALAITDHLDTARRALDEIRQTFGLTLPPAARAAQLRTLDRAAAMAVAGEMDDLAREIKRAIVDLKRSIAPPPKSKAEAGAEGGRGNKAVVSDTPAFTKEQIKRQRALAAVPEETVARVFGEARAEGRVPSEREVIEGGRKAHVPASGEQEWFTPEPVLEAARIALGGIIDVDPASCEAAQAAVRAGVYYTRETDGLAPGRSWAGSVWLNPPYTRGVVDRFALKLIDEIDAGRVTEAVWLSNASFDTQWGQPLCECANALCLVAGRLRFTPGSGQPAGAGAWASMILYFGPHAARFRDAFAPLGVVWHK